MLQNLQNGGNNFSNAAGENFSNSMPGEIQFSKMSKTEWWIGSGTGGYCAGTASGANTRKYHGIFSPAISNAQEKFILCQKLEEFLIANGQKIPLSSNYYPNTVYPQGYKNIADFSFDGAVARWTFAAAGRRLSKEVWCERGKNVSYARYTLLGGESAGLEILPFVNGRKAHDIGLAQEAANFEADARGASFSFPAKWKILADRGVFVKKAQKYFNFIYPVEQEREEKCSEDLFCPGNFSTMLQEGHHITLQIAMEADIEGCKFGEPILASGRMERIAAHFLHHNEGANAKWILPLVRASDLFLYSKGGQYGIMAGFPYFGEWGRDTMISLPGICAYTGRHALARHILDRWIAKLKGGMLPNLLDENEEGIYESADGALWMFWALGELENEGGLRKQDIKKWFRSLNTCLECWIEGSEFFEIENDGLASLKKERLTWMDAKVGGKAITPRKGKRVEINALWANALELGAKWAGVCGAARAKAKYFDLHAQASASMQKFYSPALGYLYDAIEPADSALRPNQLWALCLDNSITNMQRKHALLQVSKHLFVPGRGLRTLSEGDVDYVGEYGGSVRKRDLAYHQGTIWPWLFGAYAAAMRQNFGSNSGELASKAKAFLKNDGALLSVAEVYDPKTLEGRGCPAQAWSVGEVLRAAVIAERGRGALSYGQKYGTAAYRASE